MHVNELFILIVFVKVLRMPEICLCLLTLCDLDIVKVLVLCLDFAGKVGIMGRI
jgi:hypothetical protein